MKSSDAREHGTAIAVLAITVLKVFFRDLWELGGIYRVIAFVVFGVLLVAVAIAASSSYVKSQTATLKRGESLTVGGYGVRFTGLKQGREPHRDWVGAEMEVTTPGGGRDVLAALLSGFAHVDAVEINPIIANDVMRGRFAEYSGRVYDHPKVRIFVEDGRSYVRRTPERYDVIFSEPSNPWIAGVAALFTREFFEAARDRLAPGGVLVHRAQVGRDPEERVLRAIRHEACRRGRPGQPFQSGLAGRRVRKDRRLLAAEIEQPLPHGGGFPPELERALCRTRIAQLSCKGRKPAESPRGDRTS